jgi:hypothetical protein
MYEFAANYLRVEYVDQYHDGVSKLAINSGVSYSKHNPLSTINFAWL